jgi:hypoxanthine-guanine phosphoribosyltransferase
MCLQLADQSVRYPAGITENISVKIQNFFVPIDFVVLDMQEAWRHLSFIGDPSW